MLNVSSAIKTKFQSDLCRKEIRITIGSTVLTNSAIYKDGFKLTEAVMDGTVELIGCIASMLEFKVSTLSLAKGDYKGRTVTAEVAVYLNDGTLSNYIPLFHGFVDECTKSADGYYQQFVCYDRLAYLSDEPGYNMYKAAFNGSSVDLESFRGSIVTACGMTALSGQTLPNDDIVFRKRKRNKDVTAMALLRHIAQINGMFGIINRNNQFEFRGIDDAASPESVAYYRELKYSDYVVKPVGDSTTTPPTGSITIRTNQQDAGVTVDWTNYSQYAGTDPGWSDESQDTYLVDDDDANVVVDSYIIESNLISYKLKAAKKRVIGANILASVGHDAVFREHTVKCNGLPYVECCDKVLFTKGDNTQIEFVVTKRVLEGIQNMTDTYTCTIDSQDSNNKTFVSNVDSSTKNLSGVPADALGLTEKNITSNGSYAATEDGAEGYSVVNVNVPSSGGGGVGLRFPWTKLTDLPFSFIRGTCIVYHNKIHCFGSTHSDSDSEIQKHYVYDAEHDTWTRLNNLPIGQYQLANQTWYTIVNYSAFIYQDILYITGLGPAVFTWNETYDVWEIHDGSLDFYNPPYTFDGCLYAEFNNRLHIFDGNNGQLNVIQVFLPSTVKTNYITMQGTLTPNWDPEHPQEVACVPWPCQFGVAVVVNGECHVFGGGCGDEPEEDIFYDEIIRFNAYYDGVTPSWLYHAASTDGVTWTRKSAPPINIAYPLYRYYTEHSYKKNQTSPSALVIDGKIHLIIGSQHLVYDPTTDAWGLSDNFCVPNDITHVYDPANIMQDATYSGIVVLNNEIHVIGGYSNTTQHWKCAAL